MDLINEKAKLLSIASRLSGNHIMPSIDVKSESYYLKYAESKHMENVLWEYDFDNIAAYRKVLSQLWKGTDLADCIPVILAGISKINTERMGQVEEVQLYNYMM